MPATWLQLGCLRDIARRSPRKRRVVTSGGSLVTVMDRKQVRRTKVIVFRTNFLWNLVRACRRPSSGVYCGVWSSVEVESTGLTISLVESTGLTISLVEIKGLTISLVERTSLTISLVERKGLTISFIVYSSKVQVHHVAFWMHASWSSMQCFCNSTRHDKSTNSRPPLIPYDSSSRPPGKSGWRLVTSKNHLSIAPVHTFTTFVHSACTGT